MSLDGTDFKVHKIINGNYLFSYDGFNYTLRIENKYQRIKYKTRELYKLFKDTPYVEILDSYREPNGNIRELPNGLMVYMDFSKHLTRKRSIKNATLKVGKMRDELWMFR